MSAHALRSIQTESERWINSTNEVLKPTVGMEMEVFFYVT